MRIAKDGGQYAAKLFCILVFFASILYAILLYNNGFERHRWLVPLYAKKRRYNGNHCSESKQQKSSNNTEFLEEGCAALPGTFR